MEGGICKSAQNVRSHFDVIFHTNGDTACGSTVLIGGCSVYEIKEGLGSQIYTFIRSRDYDGMCSGNTRYFLLTLFPHDIQKLGRRGHRLPVMPYSCWNEVSFHGSQ